MQTLNGEFPLSRLCGYFGVSRQAYYWGLGHQVKAVVAETFILELVCGVRRKQPRIGTRKLYHKLGIELSMLDSSMGRDKFFDLLRSNNMLVNRHRKYARTTHSFSRFSQFKDLYNEVVWTSSHQAWVADITYIRVGGGFLYLSLITDAYSRKIIGHKLGEGLHAHWSAEALRMAIRQCPDTHGTIHHSDRGFQYCSKEYTDILAPAKIVSSMGEAGNCYDNAMAERVNGILKEEFMLDSVFKDKVSAQKAVVQAISTYNEERPHWSIRFQTPSEAHKGPRLKI